jgi:RNA polymerase sigma-70 factor (ECF subfamily)
MVIDDATLVFRYQLGDEYALDALFQRHRQTAYQYAFRLTRDADQASDVVADAFVRICKSLRSFRGQSAFTTWLHRIITNCFLDARKKAASRPVVTLESSFITQDGEIDRELAGNGISPHNALERRERELRLSWAIDKLPEGHRAIILLFHAEMLSYEDVAQRLNLPLGTVKSRLNRARQALRGVLMRDRDLLMAA